jgi:hypothetical protein
VTDQAAEALVFVEQTLEQGHEGAMAKALSAPYAAGKRGASWLKIKQSHTLDLVVLAAEWGSGRRTGWLSNLHLGARDPEHGGFVMLGKTFKGLTDELLRQQTESLLARERERDAYTVCVRPELVVEIEFNDVQTSSHYPGGLALRFARVKRYRPDKPASEADTIARARHPRAQYVAALTLGGCVASGLGSGHAVKRATGQKHADFQSSPSVRAAGGLVVHCAEIAIRPSDDHHITIGISKPKLSKLSVRIHLHLFQEGC